MIRYTDEHKTITWENWHQPQPAGMQLGTVGSLEPAESKTTIEHDQDHHTQNAGFETCELADCALRLWVHVSNDLQVGVVAEVTVVIWKASTVVPKMNVDVLQCDVHGV